MQLRPQVKELHGLYGAYTLSERVLQQIWLRGDFETSQLKLASGKTLRVLSPGRWNHLGGPDFKEAELQIDGVRFAGSVEVHFEAEDWYAHGHGDNPVFNAVILHVVLYKPLAGDGVVQTATGANLETLYLMPYLHCDLESYAEASALRQLEAVNDLEWVNHFMGCGAIERCARIEAAAYKRWEQKVKFAKKRLAVEGWEQACHQYLLEVLGYAGNRAPMSRIAQNYPLAEWRDGRLELKAVYASESVNWSRGGIRPANNPRCRLKSYAQLVEFKDNWPAALAPVFSDPLFCMEVDASNDGTRAFRRAVSLSALMNHLRVDLLQEVMGLTRFNTFIVDALLPLAAAAELLPRQVLLQYWQHWPVGDHPASLRKFMKQAALYSRTEPLCNGRMQGALALFMTDGAGL
jgi:hypothetical protein